MALIAWLCLVEGDNKTITLDVEDSPEVLVVGTSDSQGCEDLINQFVYEVKHALKIKPGHSQATLIK